MYKCRKFSVINRFKGIVNISQWRVPTKLVHQTCVWGGGDLCVMACKWVIVNYCDVLSVLGCVYVQI